MYGALRRKKTKEARRVNVEYLPLVRTNSPDPSPSGNQLLLPIEYPKGAYTMLEMPLRGGCHAITSDHLSFPLRKPTPTQ